MAQERKSAESQMNNILKSESKIDAINTVIIEESEPRISSMKETEEWPTFDKKQLKSILSLI